MRILKKSLSLLLAIVMIASLMVVNVAAEGEDIIISIEANKTEVGQGQDVQLTVYYTNTTDAAISTGTNGFNLYWPSSMTYKSDDSAGLYYAPGGDNENIIYTDDRLIAICGMSGSFASGKNEVAKFTFTVNEDASTSEPATFSADGLAFAAGNGTTIPSALGGVPSITVLKAFTVETVTNATSETKSYALGEKTLAQVEAELNEIDFAVEGAADGEAANLNATGWTSAPAYDATVLREYVFSGNLVGTDVVTVPDDKKAVTVTVAVTPLTSGTITASIESEIEVPATKEAGTMTEDALLALVKDAVYTIKDGAFEDTIEGTAAVTKNNIETATLDTTAEITVTFAEGKESTKGMFKLGAEATLTFTVKVVAAEIEGATVKIQGATTADDMVKVAVTLPEEALVTTGEGDAKVPTGTFTLAIDAGAAVLDTHTYEKSFEVGTAADVTVADGVASVTLTADKKLKDIEGIKTSVDEPFTVSVYYNGAALVVGKTDDNANIIGVSGKIMAAGGRDDVGGIGKPTNTPAPMTPVTPGTDEPGTDEPGTDEPGTDAPGTDEPGTDEPGTDAPAVEGPFADVAADHWAASFIAALKDAGIIGGVNDTDFAPDNNITRAEYAKMIAGAFGLEATSAEVAFADCTADDWFTPFVAACVEAGYINGVSETEFAPNENITREQACAILGRALNVAGEGELTFTDVAEVEEYAKAFVAALAEMGIVNGYEDGTFAPKNNITRAEAAKIIAGVLAAQTEEAPVEEAPAAE